jgi:hypothetical protein
MKRLLIILACFLLVAALGVLAYPVIFPVVTAEKVATDEYAIDLNFDKVRKIIVRCNALQSIVAQQYGEVVSQDWSKLDFQGLIDWDLEGEGQFVVRFDNPNIPELLHFTQTVHITKDRIESRSGLIEPHGYLKDFVTETVWWNAGGKTSARSQVKIVYERRIPVNYKSYMEEEVAKAAEKSLKGSHDAIVALIEKNRNRRFIGLPGGNE